MTKDPIGKQLQIAQSRGVHFYFADHVIGGCYDISAKTVTDVILGADMDMVRAKICGVTVAKLKEWAEAGRDDQCRKILKNGKRCRNGNDMHCIMSPEHYEKGISDMCHLHQENKG